MIILVKCFDCGEKTNHKGRGMVKTFGMEPVKLAFCNNCMAKEKKRSKPKYITKFIN